MAFTRLSLTRSGQTLWAKFQQGKGLHITRVAIGDGRLEGNTLYNATGLINERLSLAVDAVLLTEDSVQAAIVTTLDNKFVEESFSFRELAIFARDPDTMQEVVYLNDNAGEDAETIPSGTSGIKVYERLKFLVKADSSSSITFEASGNPLYLVAEDIELKADLDPVTKKLKLEQLPEQQQPVHVIATRDRDPAKPDYGLGGGAAVMLRAGPYTGTAEITLQVEESEYDAENMSAKPQEAPSGTIIIRKLEE